MKWEPEEEWLNEEWNEVFDWFFKEAKLESLKRQGVYKFIEEWANKI